MLPNAVMTNDRLRTLATAYGYMELGRAAEHLVCADLILQGYRSYLGGEGLSYDVVTDVDGRLVRIQVKSTCFMKRRYKRMVYQFKTRRNSGGKKRNLVLTDCDIVALVALDSRIIAYFPISMACGGAVELRPPGDTGRTRISGRQPFAPVDCYPFLTALSHA
jgi:hypothetical protein